MGKRIYIDTEKIIDIREEPSAAMQPHEVRVQTVFSYVSAGTELSMLGRDAAGNLKPKHNGRIGYSLSGRVVETGSAVTHVKAGDRVACVGNGAFHANEVLVAKNLVTKLPDNVSFEEAAPAAMMCFAFEGIRKLRPEIGEHILILGAGLMGQFAVQYASRVSHETILVDQNEARLELAPRDVTTLPAGPGCWEEIRKRFAPQGVESACFCVGGEVTALFEQVRAVMGVAPDGVPQGKMSFPGGARITVDLASTSGNLELLSSSKAGPGYRDPVYEAGAEYPNAYVKWSPKRNVAYLLQEVSLGRLAVKPFITDIFEFEDALSAYRKLARPGTESLAVLLRHSQ